MSVLPCSFGRHRYVGPIQHFYPAVLNGSDQRRTHLRLCPQHALELLADLEPFDVNRDISGNGTYTDEDVCISCRQPCSERSKLFFATAYPRSSDRMDFYGTIHPACREPAWLERALKPV